MKPITITRLSDGKQYTEELVSLRTINEELLAALKALLAAEDDYCDLNTHSRIADLDEAMDRARAAVNKAEGTT